MGIKEKITEINQLSQKIFESGKLPSDVLKRINYKFRLDWNYYSNRMEGGTLTREETRSVMVGNIDIQGKPLKDVLEMNGHDKVVLEILKMAKGEIRLSEKRIKDIHKSIMHEDDPEKVKEVGNWKTQPNEIINYKDEKISFPSPSMVPDAIHNILNATNASLDEFFSKKESLHPVIIAARFHLIYLTIHPFYDGNGRTARILTNLLLIACGLPPIIIKQERKKEYYQILGDIQAYGGNIDLLNLFVADRIIESQKLILDAIEGKSIDESDDFDKELQQIELRLQNEEGKVLKRTPELVQDIFEKSIKPFLDILHEKLTKLNTFFADFTINSYMDGQGNTGDKELIDTVLPEYFKKPHVREISINYQWGGFNRAGANTFWLGSNFRIRLNDFDYEINPEQGQPYKAGLKKLYSQQLTKVEMDKIVDGISAKALEDLKTSYKQVTGKDL